MYRKDFNARMDQGNSRANKNIDGPKRRAAHIALIHPTILDSHMGGGAP